MELRAGSEGFAACVDVALCVHGELLDLGEDPGQEGQQPPGGVLEHLASSKGVEEALAEVVEVVPDAALVEEVGPGVEHDDDGQHVVFIDVPTQIPQRLSGLAFKIGVVSGDEVDEGAEQR